MVKTSNPNTAPPSPLSRERVLHAALRLADEGGIESLSMRKLAQALGVQAMSLYNHVANKDDLLDGIVDRVVSEIEVPSLDTDWKTAIRRRAISAHAVLLRHPWATMPLVSRVNAGPAMLRYVDATLGWLFLRNG
jgi:AcrR family transcriptional regulator